MCHIVNTPDHGFAVIMDGPVACGKGKQSRLLVPRGAVHISTGDLAREKRKACTDFDANYGKFLDGGKYLPDKVVFQLVRDTIPDFVSHGNGLSTTAGVKPIYIGDGLVRTRYQADQIGTIFARPRMLLAFSFFITEKTALARAEKRAEEEHRSDDFDPAVVRDRYKSWLNHKDEVHKKLKAKGISLVHIDGEFSPEDVHKAVVANLDRHIHQLSEQWDEHGSFKQPKRKKPVRPHIDLLAARHSVCHPHGGPAAWQS